MLPAMRLHGYIIDGGKAPNVIPDYTKGAFIVRAPVQDQCNKLKSDVLACFEGAAKSTRCKLKITEKMNYKGTESQLNIV